MTMRLGLALSFFVITVAVGCGSATTAGQQTQAATNTQVPASDESFDRSNWDLLATDPDSHKGASVDFVGKVFIVPERDAKGVYLQVWEDARNSNNNTIVMYADPSFQVSDGDYVRVTGTVKGTFKGKNAFGGEVSAPTVIANKVEIVSATAAAPPAINTYGKATFTQSGINVTIRKVEFAASETRVFVKVGNNSGSNATVYSSSLKAVQAGTQFESTYSLDYPQLASDLLSGASTSGVVVFPKMNPNGNLKVVVEVNSANSDLGQYGTLTYTFTWR